MKILRNSSLGMGLGGLALGTLLTWAMSSNPKPLESSDVEGRVAELALVIADLKEEIRQLSSRQISQDQSPSDPAIRSIKTRAIPSRLMKSFDRLNASFTKFLEANAATAESRRGPSVAPPPLEGIDRPVDTAALEALRLNDDIDNDLRHLNWSYQKVLDVYGKPSRSQPSPGGVGHKWYYELPNGGEVVFWFVEGRVARAMPVD